MWTPGGVPTVFVTVANGDLNKHTEKHVHTCRYSLRDIQKGDKGEACQKKGSHLKTFL